MKISINREWLTFYLWVALAYLLLSLLHDVISFPGAFLQRVLNNIWRIVYIVVVNFILFEYTLPFIQRKRGIFFYNVLLAFLFFFIYTMLYSFGLYVWRLIGIRVHVYTSLTIGLYFAGAVP